MINKEELRKQMLAYRASLDEGYRRSAAQLIAEKFYSQFQAYKVFALYKPHRAEVDTAALAEMLEKAGKVILYPRVEGEEMVFCRTSEFACGYGGILEPCGGDILKPEVVATPGVAFDSKGYRLGYGKGFYDRYFARHSAVKVGFAYSGQLVQTVLPEAHDIRLNYVIQG